MSEWDVIGEQPIQQPKKLPAAPPAAASGWDVAEERSLAPSLSPEALAAQDAAVFGPPSRAAGLSGVEPPAPRSLGQLVNDVLLQGATGVAEGATWLADVPRRVLNTLTQNVGRAPAALETQALERGGLAADVARGLAGLREAVRIEKPEAQAAWEVATQRRVAEARETGTVEGQDYALGPLSDTAIYQGQRLAAADGVGETVATILRNPGLIATEGARMVGQMGPALPASAAGAVAGLGTIGAQAGAGNAQQIEQTIQAAANPQTTQDVDLLNRLKPVMDEARARVPQLADADDASVLQYLADTRATDAFAPSAVINSLLGRLIPGGTAIERALGVPVASTLARTRVGNAVTGGVGELVTEALQGGLDQVLQNVATQAPITEGVGKAAATEGLLAAGPGVVAGATEAGARGARPAESPVAPEPAPRPTPSAPVGQATQSAGTLDQPAGRLEDLAPRQPAPAEVPAGMTLDQARAAYAAAQTDEERARAAGVIGALQAPERAQEAEAAAPPQAATERLRDEPVAAEAAGDAFSPPPSIQPATQQPGTPAAARVETAAAERAPAEQTPPPDRLFADYDPQANTDNRSEDGLIYTENRMTRKAVDAAIKDPDDGAGTLLRYVAQQPDATPDQKWLADKLAPVMRQVGVKLVAPDPQFKYAGAYNNRTNELWIRQANPTLVLHESLHGVTSALLTDRAARQNNPTVKRVAQEFDDMLAHLRNYVAFGDSSWANDPTVSALLEDKQGPTSNVKELLAYGMTEKPFQAWLKTVPAPPGREGARNMWQAFKDAIMSMFGKISSAQRSFLDSLIESTGELVDFAAANPEAVRQAQRGEAERLNVDTGVPRRQAAADQEAQDPQRVFHGTPHKVERFSTQKIGTGEGAQSFGWGLYFASRKDVAEWYRSQLAGSDSFAPKQYNAVTDAVANYLSDGQSLANALQSAERRLVAEHARLKTYFWDGKELTPGLTQRIDDIEQNLDLLEKLSLDDFVRTKAGRTYSVDVPEDNELLDYDKPLSEQPEKVRTALAEIDSDLWSETGSDYDPNASGSSIYNRIADIELTRVHGKDIVGRRGKAAEKLASEALLRAGIPGLRYLDGSSRGKGQGSYNYVIWDEGRISDPELDPSRITPAQKQAQRQTLIGQRNEAAKLAVNTDAARVDQDKAPRQTETEAFKKWFGDSQVVDENGDPLVVYHGTNQTFDRFDEERLGTNTKMLSAKAFFFTDDADEASGYAELAAKRMIPNAKDHEKKTKELTRQIEAAERRGDWDEFERLTIEIEDHEYGAIQAEPEGAQVYAAYLSAKNPKRVSVNGMINAGAVSDLIDQAIADGNDGLILEKIQDGPTVGAEPTNHYVVFRPTQIKSATGNQGGFDQNNPAIDAARITPQQKQSQRQTLLGHLAANGYPTQGQPVPPPSGGFWTPLSKTADNLRENLQDRMLPLLRAQERAAPANKPGVTSIGLPDVMNAYRMENLMHGATKDLQEGSEQKYILPLQRRLKNLGMSLPTFEGWLLARAAEEVNTNVAKIKGAMQDGAAGITTAEAKAVLNGTGPNPYTGKPMTPAQLQQAAILAPLVDDMRDAILRNMVEAGQITPKLATQLKAKYKFYIPMRGTDVDAWMQRTTGTGKGLGQTKANIKRRLGRGAGNLPQNILGEMAGDMQRSNIAKAKATANQALLRFLLANPMPDLAKVEPVDLEWKYSEATGEAYLGVKSGADDLQRSIIVMHDGQPVRIRFEDEGFRDAAMNMGADDMRKLVKVLGAVNRWRSAVLTRFNPAFTPVNILRDFIFGVTAISAEKGAGVALSSIGRYNQAAFAIAQDNLHRPGDSSVPDAQKTMADWAREAAETGMKTGLTQVDDVVDLQRRMSLGATTLMQLAREGRPFRLAQQSVERAIKPIAEAIENVNDAYENALRLSVYVAMRKRGETRFRAAEYAKNVTINFNRRGKWGPALNALYLFYNASMQGTHAVARVLRNPKVATFLVGMAGLQAMLAGSMMDDDDDGDGITTWDTIPDYVKRTSLVIPLGPLTGRKGDYFALPMPFGFNLFTYTGGRTMQWAKQGSRPTDPSFVGDIVKSMTEAFMPIPVADGYGSLFGDQVGFAMQLAANRDDMGRKIANTNEYAEYDEPAALTGRPDTPRAYQAVAQLLAKLGGGNLEKRIAPVSYLDVAPEQLEAMVNYIGGGLASLANKGFRWWEQMDARNLETGMDQVAATPIVSRLVGTGNAGRTIADRYYAERGELARKRDVIDDRIRRGEDPDKVLEEEAAADPTLADLAPARYARDTPTASEGQIKRTDTGAAQLTAGPGSVTRAFKQSEKAVKALNKAIRGLRAPELTNQEAADIVAAYDIAPSQIGLPDGYINVVAPNRVRQRAIRLLQDQRQAAQQEALRSVESAREDQDD